MTETGIKDRKLLRLLGRIGKHPALIIATAFALFVTGAIELAEELIPEFEHFLGTHHGLMIMGLAGMVRGMTDLFEGMQEISELEE